MRGTDTASGITVGEVHALVVGSRGEAAAQPAEEGGDIVDKREVEEASEAVARAAMSFMKLRCADNAVWRSTTGDKAPDSEGKVAAREAAAAAAPPDSGAMASKSKQG